MDYVRREFLLKITHTGACVLCGGALASLLTGCGDEGNPASMPPVIDDPVIDLSNEPSLQNVGGAVKKRISVINSGRTILIVRTGDTSFAVFAAQCTHQGFEVDLPANNVIVCQNHGSRFNATTGNVVQGPAAAPLLKFTATYDAGDNTVTIS